jgi:hypothetical protein
MLTDVTCSRTIQTGMLLAAASHRFRAHITTNTAYLERLLGRLKDAGVAEPAALPLQRTQREGEHDATRTACSSEIITRISDKKQVCVK